MPSKVNQESSATLKFGGGVNSRASEDDIDVRECSSGENFELDPNNQEFRGRAPFDLIGTVPNGSEIRGFVSHLKADGTVSLLVQAAGDVYEWDGVSTFTSVGSVNSSAKLRGRIEHNWQLDDKVLITDLNLVEEIHEWDGSTFQQTTFTDENGSAFGTFRAKYCYISKERAVFGNVLENGNTTPHLLVGSKRGDYKQITVANRPSSALSEEDPFFLIQPDYRAINGVIEAFGVVITSSTQGSLFRLDGESAKDFAFSELYPRVAAVGGESLVWAGNDIFYGRQGRIESVISSERFGDVHTASISNMIADQLSSFNEWISVFNSRNNRVYFFPVGQQECWVYFKSVADRGLLGDPVSPWSKWTTQHSSAFNPSAVMNAYDPADGLEYVFFGDGSGNVYRMEGTRNQADAGSADIKSFRLSSLVALPLDSQSYELEGYVRWRRNNSHTLTIRFEYAGEHVFNKSVDIDLPATEGTIYYSGGSYYGNAEYYGTLFQDRLSRRIFPMPGTSNEFQVRTEIEGSEDFRISEIGIRFIAAS